MIKTLLLVCLVGSVFSALLNQNDLLNLINEDDNIQSYNEVQEHDERSVHLARLIHSSLNENMSVKNLLTGFEEFCSTFEDESECFQYMNENASNVALTLKGKPNNVCKQIKIVLGYVTQAVQIAKMFLKC